jgi:hypothetical protein
MWDTATARTNPASHRMTRVARVRFDVPAALRQSPTRLPPVSLLQLPVVSPMNPPVRDPTLVRLWRTIPSAGGPDVVVAFPAVVPGDPHVASVRRRTPALVNRSRRPDANHNLRERSRRQQCKSKQYCQCNLLHNEKHLQGLEVLPNTPSIPALLKRSTRYAANACAPILEPHSRHFYHLRFFSNEPDCSVESFSRNLHRRRRSPVIERRVTGSGALEDHNHPH